MTKINSKKLGLGLAVFFVLATISFAVTPTPSPSPTPTPTPTATPTPGPYGPNLTDTNVYNALTGRNALLRAVPDGAGHLIPAFILVNSNGDPASLPRTGAANYANGQVTASGTAQTLVAGNATRRSVVIRNLDTSLSVYIGAATVTSGNGFLLKAGESISIDTVALIQVIAASGSPVVAYMQTYD
jgi:hypothetical protein